MAVRDRPGALRLACVGFSSDETGALRSLLRLLDQYLKHPWHIAAEGEADLVLRNLDARADCERIGATRVIGCALKPRAHPSGTIHRPLRAAELLSVLNEVHGEVALSAQNVTRIEWSYRLRAWPLDYTDWPRDWWAVLAAMTPTARSQNEIVERTGLTPAEIERCIARLQAAALLDRFAERRAHRPPEKKDTGAWRALARRVGRVLGFGA